MQKKEHGVIDRFEGDCAVIVLTDKETITVPSSAIKNAREGDCVTVRRNDNKVTVTVDKAETERKNKSIRSRFDRLKK